MDTEIAKTDAKIKATVIKIDLKVINNKTENDDC